VLTSYLQKRLTALRSKLALSKLDGIVISQPENRYYLSGFSGSSGLLLISQERAAIFVDGRYWTQVVEESPQFELVRQNRTEPYAAQFARVIPMLGRVVGFEAAHISVAQQRDWLQPVTGVTWKPTRDFVETLRVNKDESEIEKIRSAAHITDEALGAIMGTIHAGLAESALSWQLERWMREHGADEMAFQVSVASGENSAKPHAHGSTRPLQAGDPVWIDLGAKKAHYCADMTRAFSFGKPFSGRYRELWEVVRQAQEKALSAVRPGVPAVEIDRIARDWIAQAGFGGAFNHALGHGVGLAVHEAPIISPLSKAILSPGMVITIEPGIYLPGWGGIRIEDLLVVRENGNEVLSHAEKRVQWK